LGNIDKPKLNRKNRNSMKMRKLAFMAAIALAFGVLAGLPSAAQALTIGDGNYLGSVTPPEPSSPTDEEGYINRLLPLSPGVHVMVDPDGITRTYDRSSVSCGTCPAAVFSGIKQDGGFVDNGDGTTNVDLGAGGFTYLLAKYDGPNGADAVWNVQGLTGIVTIPLNAFGYGLSHWSLFGPGSTGVPDGGTTVMLLGAALGALGMARRFLKR
jgi:VPDSG-CTERM motif